jgi:hypothetical protein
MFEDDPQLTAFARDLRSAADATPPPAVGASLAAVLEGRAAATAPDWLPRSAPRRRAGMRWVIGGAVFGLGIGSLGVAGALPDPVQRQVAHLGDVVGVDLPEPAADTPATSVVPTSVPPSTVPPARTSTTHTTGTTLPVHEDGRGADDGVVGEHPGPGTSVENPGQGDEHRDDNSQGDHGSPDATDDRGTTTPAGDGDGGGDDHGDSVDKQTSVPDVERGSSSSSRGVTPPSVRVGSDD